MATRPNPRTLSKNFLHCAIFAVLLFSGCGGQVGSQGQSSSTPNTNGANGTLGATPDPGTTSPSSPTSPPVNSGNGSNPGNPTPGGTNPTTPNFKNFESLAWEKSNPERRAWSELIYSVIQKEEPQMLDNGASQDVDQFCPRFQQITKEQRLNFWGQLISAMSYFESGWNPKSRYWEKTMGKDPITGQNVYSEGLLQLSYQDIQGYKFCEFDWQLDQVLSPTDSKKTIFDPAKNLRCGVKILAKQLLREKLIASNRGVYWAVLSRNGSYNKISQITEMTKSLSFCR